MIQWNKTEAKNHFEEIIKASRQSPQILYENTQPVAVVIDIELFNQLPKNNNPSIAEMLDELNVIQQENPIEIEISERTDRSNPLIDER